jgi:predicted DCC family thiol-disulfide oxidoreductase YuxK
MLGGAAALPEILRRLRGWRWAAALFRLPGAALVAPLVYRWVARNRYRISCAIGAARD